MLKLAATLLIPLLLILAGCSEPPPSHEEVKSRLIIEYPDDALVPAEYFDEVFDAMASDALNGLCGSFAYERWFYDAGVDALFYAWRMTCLTYFEDDLTPSQVEDSKDMLFDGVVEDLLDN